MQTPRRGKDRKRRRAERDGPVGVERERRLLALQLEVVGLENPHTENGHGPRGSKSGRPLRVLGRPEGQEAPSGEAEHSGVTEPTPAREAGHPQPLSSPPLLSPAGPVSSACPPCREGAKPRPSDQVLGGGEHPFGWGRGLSSCHLGPGREAPAPRWEQPLRSQAERVLLDKTLRQLPVSGQKHKSPRQPRLSPSFIRLHCQLSTGCEPREALTTGEEESMTPSSGVHGGGQGFSASSGTRTRWTGSPFVVGIPAPAAHSLCGCIPALPAPGCHTTKKVPLRVTVLRAQRCGAELCSASQECPSSPFAFRPLPLSPKVNATQFLRVSSGARNLEGRPPPSEVAAILLLITMRKPHCWECHQTEKILETDSS